MSTYIIAAFTASPINSFETIHKNTFSSWVTSIPSVFRNTYTYKSYLEAHKIWAKYEVNLP